MGRVQNYLLALGTLTTFASACFVTVGQTPWSADAERTPCTARTSTGSCATYLTCPQGIVYKKVGSGWHECVTDTIVAPARVYADGVPSWTTFCCSSGTFLANHPTVTCTMSWDTVRNDGCIEAEPFPE